MLQDELQCFNQLLPLADVQLHRGGNSVADDNFGQVPPRKGVAETEYSRPGKLITNVSKIKNVDCAF